MTVAGVVGGVEADPRIRGQVESCRRMLPDCTRIAPEFALVAPTLSAKPVPEMVRL